MLPLSDGGECAFTLLLGGEKLQPAVPPRGREQDSGATLAWWPFGVLHAPRWLLGKEESAIFVEGSEHPGRKKMSLNNSSFRLNRFHSNIDAVPIN